jgi:hypothetical protein
MKKMRFSPKLRSNKCSVLLLIIGNVRDSNSGLEFWKLSSTAIHSFFAVVNAFFNLNIMFTPARDFLLETPWRILIPNPNVNSLSL